MLHQKLTPEQEAFYRRVIEETREACKNVIFITPKAPPPLPWPSWIPEPKFIFIDYLHIAR
ncbi:hypothetical protein D3C71_77330 [compost metagenome]